MSTYNATILWKRKGQSFTDNQYDRVHFWQFDGGVKVPASSSPQIVPVPFSDPTVVDPEEAFLASLASCHMLWFQSIAAKRSFVVDEYKDSAEAIMGKNSEGKLAIIKVILHPIVKFSANTAPSEKENVVLHHEAHENCFIANSVCTHVEIQPALKK